jgi:hypothetical protein
MAVMSIFVLFLGILILGINSRLIVKIDAETSKIHTDMLPKIPGYLYCEAKLCVKVKPLSSIP